MKVIIYGRAHRNGAQLATQMECLRRYCQSRDYEVVKEVTDCCSGSQSGDNLIRLLKEPGKEFDSIVLRDPSRISRNLVIMVEIVKMMKAKGIRLITTEIPELNTIKGNSLITKVS